MWKVCGAKLNEVVCKHTPKNLRKKHSKPLWWNHKVDLVRKRKAKAWRNYDYVYYKKSLDIATREVRSAKRQFERKLACNIKDDPKAFYRYARSKIKTRFSWSCGR